jgi:hypothetical protein
MRQRVKIFCLSGHVGNIPSAGFEVKVHPFLIRNSCGQRLASTPIQERSLQGL